MLPACVQQGQAAGGLDCWASTKYTGGARESSKGCNNSNKGKFGYCSKLDPCPDLCLTTRGVRFSLRFIRGCSPNESLYPVENRPERDGERAGAFPSLPRDRCSNSPQRDEVSSIFITLNLHVIESGVYGVEKLTIDNHATFQK